MGKPHERPPGYEPPKSVEELLERYARGERWFSGVYLSQCRLPGANLSGAGLVGAFLQEANLSEADLQAAILNGANLAGARLYRAHLASASLLSANLIGAQLEGAKLAGACLSDSNLKGSMLMSADLSNARLNRAKLAGANLAGANLAGADLTDADLQAAILTGANFSSARLGGTNLSGLDLSPLCGAPSIVLHSRPSTVDPQTIVLSIRSPRLKGFLVRTGMHDYLADVLIEYAKSVEASIFTMMRSTFISYGAPDEAFARKLYEALYRSGVTTFLFSEHAEPGQKLHRVMRDGVNQHDRVLLVCSKASLDRKGVLNEIEETLAREARDGGETYLIPIRLDDYVFNGWKPKRADIAQAVRDRVVADFEGAEKDEDKFTCELSKLLRALRKPSPAGASGASGSRALP